MSEPKDVDAQIIALDEELGGREQAAMILGRFDEMFKGQTPAWKRGFQERVLHWCQQGLGEAYKARVK